MEIQTKLKEIYAQLFAFFGPQHWWPGETPLEVVVGAILTQSTAWRNVEQAITRLKAAGLLSVSGILTTPLEELAQLIVPSGYYNVKARKLKAFFTFLQEEYGGSLEAMFATPWPQLRTRLLAVYGIGPETADSILLYAGEQPTFVVDAYTRRIFARLGLCAPDCDYESLRALFMEHLPPSVPLFNEYHALLVALGKDYCRKSRPVCPSCPIRIYCHERGMGPEVALRCG